MIKKSLQCATEMRKYFGLRKACRFIVDTIKHPILYADWLNYVDEIYATGAAGFIEGWPWLAQKPSLRYLRKWFSTHKKMATIRYHYTLMAKIFAPDVLNVIQSINGLEIARTSGKDGKEYVITLQQAPTKEGELTFRFKDTTCSEPLALLRGSLGQDENRNTILWIGSLQGPSPPIGKGEILAATKNLYGLRPKQAVVHAACAFSRLATGAIVALAPSNAEHISNGKLRLFLQREKLHANYDAFWEEYTSQKSQWGDFLITLPLSRRNIEDVQPKRRKDWMQRYARLDAMTDNIAKLLQNVSDYSQSTCKT